MRRSPRTVALSLTLLAACCAPAFADSPGGTNPVPPPPKTQTTSTVSLLQTLLSLLGL